MSKARAILVALLALTAVLFVTLALWTPHPWRCLLTALILGMTTVGFGTERIDR